MYIHMCMCVFMSLGMCVVYGFVHVHKYMCVLT